MPPSLYEPVRDIYWRCKSSYSAISRTFRKRKRNMQFPDTMYSQWSPEELTKRILLLEKQLREVNERLSQNNKKSLRSDISDEQASREIDPSKYSTRLIALKFAYIGRRYNGFEFAANNKTPLPTIEEVLWQALKKACLIFPGSTAKGSDNISWEGCDYTKCGRTDRGVSAFGQVIGLRVRSNRPLGQQDVIRRDLNHAMQQGYSVDQGAPVDNGIKEWPTISSYEKSSKSDAAFDHIRDEIPYPQILNRLLPPDIRILAWCPTPPADFSARFSCRERQYRYFFTQPAFIPTLISKSHDPDLEHSTESVSNTEEGWLDIDAMNDAAARFQGLHDFRNFCKVDASKQLDDFKRRIYLSEIREADLGQVPTINAVESQSFQMKPALSIHASSSSLGSPKTYAFVLHGSAFLWHQVRHMIAILFLVGQGLETPDIVDKLLDVKTNPRRPVYDMADETPLVLWDCIFPYQDDNNREDALNWIYAGDKANVGFSIANDKSGSTSTSTLSAWRLVSDIWQMWRQTKIDEILAANLLSLSIHHSTADTIRSSRNKAISKSNHKIFLGGNSARIAGRYMPLMQRRTLDSVETINLRYAKRKGLLENAKKKKKSGFSDQRSDHAE